ncbi:hypothetical protein DOY81_014704, partial [Sarcophaga bullata]
MFKCPKCSVAPLALKAKKNQTGFFIGCLNFPDCKNCIWLSDECKEPTVLDETCTKCGNDIKLLKFKFSNSYHKTLFNSPSGWYKTCLRCDVQFRNTFNINVESVKRVGGIVGDSSSIPINYGTGPPSTGNAGGGRQKKDSSTKTKKSGDQPDNETKVKKVRKTLAKSTTTNTNQATNANIRSYFTSAMMVSMILYYRQKRTVQTPNPTQNNTTFKQHLPFNDDNDDIFADIQWGTGNQTISSSLNQNSTRNRDERLTSNVDLEDSFVTLLRDDDASNDDDYVWGTAAKNARLSQNGPPAKKTKVQQIESINDGSYTWGRDSRINTEASVAIKCSGLSSENVLRSSVLKLLSVKKDGPNKGRIFYACPKSNACKFFQWADDINRQVEQSNTSNSWSTSSTDNIASGSRGYRTVDLPEDKDAIN